MTHDATRRVIESMPEPYRGEGVVDVSLTPESAQDLKNGTAMRRLREAADRHGWDVKLFAPFEDGQDDDHAEDWMAVADRDDRSIVEFGATVAAAADKCREALEE